MAPPHSVESVSTGNGQESAAEFALNRGEVRGGYWEEEDKLIIYGGLHVRDYSVNGHEEQADETLGDVWAYDFKTDTWEMLAPTWDAGSVYTKESEVVNHPGERTSHAGIVVGDELVIYGGLKKVDMSAWSGVKTWDQLDDVWVFNLKERTWKERETEQSMGRAYHAAVGWKMEGRNGTILSSFGGVKMMIDPVNNQEISYVYDDTIVTFPPPEGSTGNSLWFLATITGDFSEMVIDTVSTRLEHTVILSKAHGNMFCWGGRYRGTSEISGMWSLNVAGESSQVNYVIRGNDADMANVGVAYVVLITIMLMSMSFTYTCGVLQRRMFGGAEVTNADIIDHGGLPGIFIRRNGLRQDIIDTLPLKKYSSESAASENSTPSSMTEGQSVDEMNYNYDDENCCPICLVEYEEGDEIRRLPCNHEFHKSCVDAWLGNNASCPSCRHSLEDLTLLTTNVELANPSGEGDTSSTQETSGGLSSVHNFARAIRTQSRRLPQLFNSIQLRNRSNNESPNLVSSSDQSQYSQSEGDLDLDYSLELVEDIGNNDNASGSDREDQIQGSLSPDERDLPLEGRSRRMRILGRNGRRPGIIRSGRVRRQRRSRNRRSFLNEPLTRGESELV